MLTHCSVEDLYQNLFQLKHLPVGIYADLTSPFPLATLPCADCCYSILKSSNTAICFFDSDIIILILSSVTLFLNSVVICRHNGHYNLSKAILFIYFFYFFFFNVYLFLGQRETEHEWGRGRERGRHRIGNRLQALSHQPRARRGARAHGP